MIHERKASQVALFEDALLFGGDTGRNDDSSRDECLNTHWFLFLEDVKNKVEQRRNNYNHFRPHRGLTYKTPPDFAGKDMAVAI